MLNRSFYTIVTNSFVFRYIEKLNFDEKSILFVAGTRSDILL